MARATKAQLACREKMHRLPQLGQVKRLSKELDRTHAMGLPKAAVLYGDSLLDAMARAGL